MNWLGGIWISVVRGCVSVCVRERVGLGDSVQVPPGDWEAGLEIGWVGHVAGVGGE